MRKRNLWVVCKSRADPFELALRAVAASTLSVRGLYGDASNLTENVETALPQLPLLHIQTQRDF